MLMSGKGPLKYFLHQFFGCNIDETLNVEL